MYAVSTVKSMPWLNTTPVAEKKTKSRKSKQGSAPIHPIFDECSRLTDDPYWKSVLAQAGTGKFPRGFSYKTGQLIYKRGNKIQKVDINENPVEVLTVALDFFRSSGLRSTQDTEREQRQLEEQLAESEPISSLSWSDIRKKKKSLPGLYIEAFIRDIVKINNLTEYQRKQLTTIINIGLILGYLSDSDIAFDGNITGIKGLGFNQERREFVLELPRKSQTKSRLKTIPDDVMLDPNYKLTNGNQHISFVDMWYKFLEGVNKDNKNSVSIRVVDTPSMEDSSNYSGELY